MSSTEELIEELKNVQTWKVEEKEDNEISIKLVEEPYSIPKYAVLIDSGLEFIFFVY